jgi:serine protease
MTPIRIRRPALRRAAPAAAVLALALPAAAHAAGPHAATAMSGPDYRQGEVVVRYARSAGRSARAAVQRSTGVGDPHVFAPRTRVLKIRDGASVYQKVIELRARPEVASAAPNPVARVSAYIPQDPGNTGVPGGWQSLQWNFLAGTGVNAPEAWQHLIDKGRPGGTGVTVAVLDTGVAYSSSGRCPKTPESSALASVGCLRSPDFHAGDFVRGYDFVDNDPQPHDENGHGTHVAGTIGEGTGDSIGVTGLAYGARIMPVRVLDRLGEGDSAAISAGIRYAARNGAQVINLSFEFGSQVTRSEIPDIISALRYARRRGALVVAASGNAAARSVAYPARAVDAMSVGATTQHGCVAEYSNSGANLDISAPGGGEDAALRDDPNCHPLDPPGGNIYQMTFEGSTRRFGLPGDYMGTSMAAPHVAAAAALVIASGVLGPKPSPAAVEQRLKDTAHDLGTAGPDSHYGAGLVDAAAATAP